MYLRIFLFFKFLLLDLYTIYGLEKKKENIRKLFIINIIKYKIYAVYVQNNIRF